MKARRIKALSLLAALLPAMLAGCVAPVGPVAVTRFHAPDVSPLGKGEIVVEPAPGGDPASLEWQTYSAAVMRQLQLLGYSEGKSGTSAQVAQVRVTRRTVQPERSNSPVSVGVGGSTGTYGSGLGIGIGINLSPSLRRRSQPTSQSRSAIARAERCYGKGGQASPSPPSPRSPPRRWPHPR